MNVILLHKTPWLDLRMVREPEAGIDGYIYSHESRSHGRIVAVLPFRDAPAGGEWLVRREVTPCWSLDPTFSAITGGYEGGDIADDAVHEMAEETGYIVRREDLVPLGESYASKSADTIYSLFTVDLTGRVAGDAPGDGSVLEAQGTAVWMTEQELVDIRDPQVAVMLLRAKAHTGR